MEKITKIINCLKSQVGITENPAHSNKIKYNDAYYNKKGAVAQWCVIFLWWVFKECDLSQLFYSGMRCASCGTMYSHATKNKLIVFKPVVGAMVLFDFTQVKRPTHIGYIIQVNKDGTFLTIEGNTGTSNNSNGGEVMIRKRSQKYVYAYILPKYDEEIVHNDEKVIDNSQNMEYIIDKTYVTCVNNLNVRTGAGLSYKVKTKDKLTKNAQMYSNDKGQLLKGTKVTVKGIKKDTQGNVWVKIPSGYICALYNNKQYIK